MQNIQLKKPYLAPEIVSVDFKVERGMQGSPSQVELGVKGQEDDQYMYFGALQRDHQGSRMGDQMFSGNYFGEFTPGEGPSGAGYFGGYYGGSYF